MKRVLMLAALLALTCAQAKAEGDPAPGDAIRGQEIYESRCIACHSPDANRVGPMHRGVFGRKAGSLPGYTYSKALKGTDFVWDDETLDRWLTNPQAFVPGQKMNFRVAKPEDRADIIAYLKTLK